MNSTPAPKAINVRATYMRGGTSKGVFFNLSDLPATAQKPGAARDALFLRVIGSPDPYGKQIDGMGGASSSTSKVVIVSKSNRADHDVDYLFGQVAIDRASVDWSGNCGNLTSAVGPFAVHAGLIPLSALPKNGAVTVRIWQANINKTIIAHVPVIDGVVQEYGDFELDGVTFPSAEIVLEFLNPSPDEGEGKSEGRTGGAGGAMFPTGQLVDDLAVPTDVVASGRLSATLINAGIPTVFVNAHDLGYRGTELQEDINGDAKALARFEKIRALGALKMGLIKSLDEAQTRQHTPKIAMVAPAQTYTASSGKEVHKDNINLCVRALSMGKLHHAMMGTAAVAIGTAGAIPGTLVHRAAGGGDINAVCFGHASGTMRVGASAQKNNDQWTVTKAVMSRSARILMDGMVRVPSTGG